MFRNVVTRGFLRTSLACFVIRSILFDEKLIKIKLVPGPSNRPFNAPKRRPLVKLGTASMPFLISIKFGPFLWREMLIECPDELFLRLMQSVRKNALVR